MNALLGRKIGMSQTFDAEGTVIPVTVLEVGPCTVVQVKNREKEGYCALQLGFEDAKPSRVNRPQTGHFEKAGVSPKRVLREVRVAPERIEEFKPGQELTVDLFKVGDVVDVVGTSKGHGMTGVMTRWNFHGAKASHGSHERRRHGGSAGMGSDPGRTPRGWPMPGRTGNARVTVKNLPVVDVIPEKNVLLVRGAVPGHRKGLVLVRSAVSPKKAPAKS